MNKVTLESVAAEFRSGNSIPVERATFTRERMQEVLEAYADARVRGALELAAQTCENQGRATTTLDGESFYIALGQAARAIRALIPPLSGPVEPTT